MYNKQQLREAKLVSFLKTKRTKIPIIGTGDLYSVMYETETTRTVQAPVKNRFFNPSWSVCVLNPNTAARNFTWPP